MLNKIRFPFVGPPVISTGTNFMPSEFINGDSFVAVFGVGSSAAKTGPATNAVSTETNATIGFIRLEIPHQATKSTKRIEDIVRSSFFIAQSLHFRGGIDDWRKLLAIFPR